MREGNIDKGMQHEKRKGRRRANKNALISMRKHAYLPQTCQGVGGPEKNKIK